MAVFIKKVMRNMQTTNFKNAFLSVAFFSLAQVSSFSFAQSPQTLSLYHRSLAATCANCHGTDGKGVVDGGMPLINNLTSQQMLEQLKAYKSGAREGTIMPQLAKGYTDEQLEIISLQLGKK
jgi:sulfide dehydrogenase cytochrome subunit